MDSKKPLITFSFRVMLLILVAVFVVTQSSFADDDEKKSRWWDNNSSSSQSDSDDERRRSSRDGEHDKDRDDEHDKHDDDDDQPPPGGGTSQQNFVAIHDSGSSQYNDNCSSCHSDIHTRQSLNPSFPDAHVAMLPFAPGEGNNKCTWCHRSVDLVQAAGSSIDTGNTIRKRIDPRLCTLCHGPSGPGKRFYAVDFSAVQLDGADLYGLTCSGCHRPLANSEMRGEDAAEIRDAIAENEGGMGVLRVLSDGQIDAIAAALNGQASPLPPPDSTPPTGGGEGAALYALNCAACHGALPGEKEGASANQIQNAINNNTGGMGQLNLTTAQIDAIAATLSGQTTPPPTGGVDGAALYASSCAACHGALPGEKEGASVNQIQNAINANTGGMGVLVTLSTVQIDAIAAALNGQTIPPPDGTPPPTGGLDGVALYTSSCSACHGALPGEMEGKSASKIQSAINNDKGGMGSLNLTTAQIDAIAAALSGQTTPPPDGTPPPTGGLDGVALYTSSCSACHGALPGEMEGKSASKIQSAINDNKGGMGQLNLTAAQIDAIAAALNGQTSSPPDGTPPPTGGVDGAALYTSSCSACHGALPGEMQGKSASKIQSAIDDDKGGMGALNLTTAQIQAISAAIQ